MSKDELAEEIKKKDPSLDSPETEQEETVDETEVEEDEAVEKDPVEELKQRVLALEAENAELKEQYVRKQADYENFRKRMAREKEEAIRYANSNLLMDLIEVIDNFERAIKSAEDSQDFTVFHSGIEMIESQFTGMLERKYGLTRFESEGEEFDPQMHEAIGMESSSEYDVQTVLEVYQKGYRLGDRILRHAKVKISQPVPESAAEADSKEEKE